MIALSVIAAVVAMCATAIALWQAREAKNAQAAAGEAQEAARRAQEEAQAARKAVEQATASALQSKTATEEAKNAAAQAQEAATASRMLADEAQLTAQQATQQVNELTEVLAAERSRRGMPTFAITPGAPDEFRLSYFGGPAVIEQLTVSVVPGSRVLGLSQYDEPPAEHLDVGPLYNGSAITFRAATGQRASAVFQIRAEPWEPVVVRADQ
jgi:ATPase subunit of ABC transporter with duplicated ATPase domains